VVLWSEQEEELRANRNDDQDEFIMKCCCLTGSCTQSRSFLTINTTKVQSACSVKMQSAVQIPAEFSSKLAVQLGTFMKDHGSAAMLQTIRTERVERPTWD
jgi:hypothetical protein